MIAGNNLESEGQGVLQGREVLKKKGTKEKDGSSLDRPTVIERGLEKGFRHY